jgi:hypothetical protein
VHLAGALLVEVVVAHDPHGQQGAEDRHARVEQAQAVHRARGLRGRAGREGHQDMIAPLSRPAMAKPNFTIHQ